MSRNRSFSSVLIAGIFTLLMGCTQERLLFYPEVLPPDYRYTFPVPCREINIPVAGAVLNALHFPVADARGIILYLHGNAGSLRTWGEVAGDFTSRGYELFIYDYRGFGKSTGRIDGESQLLADARAVYEYLRKFAPAQRIVIYGRSIGTGMAAYIAREAKPQLLILESPFYSLTDLAARHYPLLPRRLLALVLKYPFPTHQWLPGVACPVYLIHGTKDAVIPYDDAARLATLLRPPSGLIRIEGGGHNDLNEFGAYDRALDRILTGAAGTAP
ncbi:MAG TPA: alpha/beta fold hydrolase [Syntrophales bacterium]|nr:alpha/beta fold hydrolase [Syntrophales bacterium]HRR47977.1 alpha/beta fold hydrolase [Syntrophales bacterium]